MPAQLALVEHVHDVALVLGPVGAARERAATVRRPADPGVVAGGDGVEAEQVGALAAAGRTSGGGCTRCTGSASRRRRGPRTYGLDDVRVEVVAEVEHEVVDAELLGDAAGVVDVGDGAAARCRSRRPTAAS